MSDHPFRRSGLPLYRPVDRLIKRYLDQQNITPNLLLDNGLPTFVLSALSGGRAERGYGG